MTTSAKPAARLKRRHRVRAKVAGTAERPRISVFRSNRGIHAQLVDDISRPHAGRRVVDGGRPARAQADGAGRQGRRAAGRAREGGRASTVALFDRGGYRYHGKVKAFAEGVREGGLKV